MNPSYTNYLANWSMFLCLSSLEVFWHILHLEISPSNSLVKHLTFCPPVIIFLIYRVIFSLSSLGGLVQFTRWCLFNLMRNGLDDPIVQVPSFPAKTFWFCLCCVLYHNLPLHFSLFPNRCVFQSLRPSFVWIIPYILHQASLPIHLHSS